MKKEIVKADSIYSKIFFIRGENVMLDRDLALLYGVDVRVLNQAVKRNIERFPPRYMFRLTKDEVITNCDNLGLSKFSPALPYVFTEQGVAMLSSVLKSKNAIAVNMQIIDTFVSLRRHILGTKADIDYTQLKKMLLMYIENNDRRVDEVIKALNTLLKAEEKEVKKIGFI